MLMKLLVMKLMMMILVTIMVMMLGYTCSTQIYFV